jgi:putative endonuclease
MAGLVPAIPIRETQHMRQFYVYILASRPGGALYVGVTNDLVRRVYEHKNKFVRGHTKNYKIDRLVYFEIHETAYQAIQREKNIKPWPRVWKTRLIAREMIHGGICRMKLRSRSAAIGIAGPGPAMTGVVVVDKDSFLLVGGGGQ